jgi:hypothetical protein
MLVAAGIGAFFSPQLVRLVLSRLSVPFVSSKQQKTLLRLGEQGSRNRDLVIENYLRASFWVSSFALSLAKVA